MKKFLAFLCTILVAHAQFTTVQWDPGSHKLKVNNTQWGVGNIDFTGMTVTGLPGASVTFATTAEAILGTSTTLSMSPKRVVDGVVFGDTYGSFGEEYLSHIHGVLLASATGAPFPKIGFAGDSQISSSGTEMDPSSNRAVNRIDRIIESLFVQYWPGCTVSNSAVSGATAADWSSSMVDADLALGLDAYVLSIALNHPGKTISQVEADVRVGFDKIVVYRRSTPISVLVTLPFTTNDYPNDRDFSWHQQLNAMYRRLCREYQFACLDTYALWKDSMHAADYMDSPYAATVNATALVTNTDYTIASVGTSNFITSGAASNTVGTVFRATGTTTGTGTATISIHVHPKAVFNRVKANRIFDMLFPASFRPFGSFRLANWSSAYYLPASADGPFVTNATTVGTATTTSGIIQRAYPRGLSMLRALTTSPYLFAFDGGLHSLGQNDDNWLQFNNPASGDGLATRNGNANTGFSAWRKFVFENTTQTLTGKTISGASNTITLAAGSVGPTELASTAVTAGSYTNTNLTVDADGRITAAASGSGSGTAWGSITGTLSAQTDVQAALDAKVATSVTVGGHALTSNVTLVKGDVGLGNVDNTSDFSKNSASGTLTNKTLSGLTNTITDLNLNSLGQSSATTGQIARWNGSVWVPYTIPPSEMIVALGDEVTDLTTGTAKVTLRAPRAMIITAVRASVNTVSSSGLVTVDINVAGSTIMTTNKLSIDASELTSTTAATPAVLTTTSVSDDAIITFDIDAAGTGAKGLKVVIYYSN